MPPLFLNVSEHRDHQYCSYSLVLKRVSLDAKKSPDLVLQTEQQNEHGAWLPLSGDQAHAG